MEDSNRVSLLYDGVIAGSATLTDRVNAQGVAELGLLFVMDNASAAGDIGAVTLKTYDGEKPAAVVANLPLNSTYTLGPILSGALSQKLVVYDVGIFVDCSYTVLNTNVAPRNLKVYGYFN